MAGNPSDEYGEPGLHHLHVFGGLLGSWTSALIDQVRGLLVIGSICPAAVRATTMRYVHPSGSGGTNRAPRNVRFGPMLKVTDLARGREGLTNHAALNRKVVVPDWW